MAFRNQKPVLLCRTYCANVYGDYNCIRRFCFSLKSRWRYWVFLSRLTTNVNRQNCVRSGIRTHAHIRGPENSLMRHEKGINLESGALDHSAILTYDQKRKIIESFILQRKNMSNWFEKSSSVWLSCLLTECLKSRSRESLQLVWICPDLAPVGITGAVAQVVERSLSMWEVRGSIPRISNLLCREKSSILHEITKSPFYVSAICFLLVLLEMIRLDFTCLHIDMIILWRFWTCWVISNKSIN